MIHLQMEFSFEDFKLAVLDNRTPKELRNFIILFSWKKSVTEIEEVLNSVGSVEAKYFIHPVVLWGKLEYFRLFFRDKKTFQPVEFSFLRGIVGEEEFSRRIVAIKESLKS